MQNNKSFLKNSVIVAAHADDEILWFSSIMKDVDRVLIAYENYWAEPGIGQRRAKAVTEIPHSNIENLQIDEAGCYGCAVWEKPELSEHGIAFGPHILKRELKRRVLRALPIASLKAKTSAKSVSENYAVNFDLLYDRLDRELTSDMNVFTHNPWGEYGHEEHIQVYRVVEKLRVKKGFTQWMSNYCTNRSLPLAMTYFLDQPTSFQRYPTDKVYAEDIAEIYRKHDCWTWRDDWAWFDDECFMQAPKEQSHAGSQAHLFPLNLFSI